MKLSSDAKRQTTVGQIVNLMSVDAQKIQDAFQFWHLIWSVPLLVGFSMYFLWQTIGVSCLSGLAVLIILVPVNGLFLANRVRNLQVRWALWAQLSIGLGVFDAPEVVDFCE